MIPDSEGCSFHLRVSKNAADEWPSSEDDGSVLIEKVGSTVFLQLSLPQTKPFALIPYAVFQNPQKVNLRKMIASKRGEGTEPFLT